MLVCCVVLCCHAFGDSIKHVDMLVQQLRAQSGLEHMYCLVAILHIIQDYPSHDIKFNTQTCILHST